MARKHSKESRRIKTLEYKWIRGERVYLHKGKSMVEWFPETPKSTPWPSTDNIERELAGVLYAVLFKEKNSTNLTAKWSRHSNIGNVLFRILCTELDSFLHFWKQGRYHRPIRRNLWFIVENFEAINDKLGTYSLPKEIDAEYFNGLKKDLEFLESFGFDFERTIRRKLMLWQLSAEKPIG